MKIHFIGIGGIGISALAQYYLSENAEISGSDIVQSEITDFLEKKGVKIFIGHKKENIKEDLDLVIFTPAIKEDNPELKRAKELNIKILNYPQALGELTKKYFTIAVCGTHGKSTTTAMLSKILIEAGLDPIVILGTKLKEFGNTNFYRKKGKILLIEADEWNASFLNYLPNIIVLTNIEKEHLDYYKNVDNLFNTFNQFINHLPEDGILIINRDDQNFSKIEKDNFKTIIYSQKDKEFSKIKEILSIPGKHNLSNALACLNCARALDISDEITYSALSEYRGAWRRFEEKEIELNQKSVILISDYGHHPTEISATIQAVKEKYSQKKIWLIFQPHQYQRTFYLFNEFVQSLSSLDIEKIILIPVYDVAGREEENIKEKVSSEKLVEELKKKEIDAVFLKDFKEVKEYLSIHFQGDVLVLMGAGDIYQLSNVPPLT